MYIKYLGEIKSDYKKGHTLFLCILKRSQDHSACNIQVLSGKSGDAKVFGKKSV